MRGVGWESGETVPIQVKREMKGERFEQAAFLAEESALREAKEAARRSAIIAVDSFYGDTQVARHNAPQRSVECNALLSIDVQVEVTRTATHTLSSGA